jgi:hypothetical protein
LKEWAIKANNIAQIKINEVYEKVWF